MKDLIEIDKYPVKDVLSLLLKDKTTGNNIIFATDTYSDYGYSECNYMTEMAVQGFASCDIQPRVLKAKSEQLERTRKKAEVFTPTWICNKMNNVCDRDWFERKIVFNIEKEHKWSTVSKAITFPEGKSWKSYVDSRRLEITCGEAPYLVSRYDTTTGKDIPIKRRIGILDRKLRVVGENTNSEEEWLKWTIRAFQSVYGYEFQGDNLLIARINLLITFCDYLYDKWQRTATKLELKKIANIIAWNIWQMDGIKNTLPEFKIEDNFLQMTFFEIEEDDNNKIFCKVQDWRKDCPFSFKDIKIGKKGKKMKFDYLLGNPPYNDTQGSGEQANYAKPVYHFFIDAAITISDKVELIHPARFLYNAGSTPKAWNEKMLNDTHFKVLLYEENCTKIFNNTDIKGGIAITYHDNNADFGAIGIFTKNALLNDILKKVYDSNSFESFSEIVVTRTAYRLTDKMHKDHPEALSQLSNGHAFDMSTNIFERLPQIFFNSKPNDNNEYIQILGRENNERVFKWVRREYVNNPKNLDKYKIYLPKANGVGAFGEIISLPIVCEPAIGATETFLSIGFTETNNEINSILKYIKTKFARCMLGVLKTTQDLTPDKWKYVPLQNFTSKSDINWNVSVDEIDNQLYKKYGLSKEEIDFIETHVKEMT